MTTAMSSGLEGYSRAESMVNTAAANIASFSPTQTGVQKPSGAPGDSVDLSANVVSLLQGKNSAQSNLATIHVADEMQKSLIDLIG